MNRARAYLSLVRPFNAGITFAGVCAAGYIAGAPMTAWPSFVAAGCAAVLLSGAGNAMNDAYDAAIDRINKPHRAVAAGIIPEAAALRFAALLLAGGLGLAAVCGALPLAIAAGGSLLMYAYNASLKRIPLVGNLVVGALTGIAFLFGAAVAGQVAYGFIPATFALLINVAREILKDVEDMDGDAASGIVTYPLHAGVRPALAVASASLGLLMIAAVLPAFFHVYANAYFWVTLPGVHGAIPFIVISVWRNSSPRSVRRASFLLKLDMLVGLAALLLGSR